MQENKQLQETQTNLLIRQQQQKEIFLEEAAKTGNDIVVRIAKAVYEPKISDIPLASDAGEKDCIDLITELRILVGQNRDTTPKQLEIEARFLQTQYGQMSISDFYICIELYFANRLDIQLPQSVVFSPLFISHLMNSYKRYRFAELKDINLKTYVRAITQKPPSNAERLSAIKEMVSERYQAYLRGENMTFYNTIVFDVLNRKKLIEFNNTIEQEAERYAQHTFQTDTIANTKKRLESRRTIALGEALNGNPASKFNRETALMQYRIDFLLQRFFKNCNISEVVDSITEKDLE